MAPSHYYTQHNARQHGCRRSATNPTGRSAFALFCIRTTRRSRRRIRMRLLCGIDDRRRSSHRTGTGPMGDMRCGRCAGSNVRCIRSMSVDGAFNPFAGVRIETTVVGCGVQRARRQNAGASTVTGQRTHDVRQETGELTLTDERCTVIDFHLGNIALRGGITELRNYA